MTRLFRVLIVDDDEDWVDYCKKKLDMSDMRNVAVEVSYSVDDAKEKIQDRLYDLVFCDYKMKYQDARGVIHNDGGFVICGHAKSYLPQAKLIMVTAYGTSELARESLVTLRFDDYMDKANNPKDDVESMRKTISQYIMSWNEESTAPNPFYAASGQMPKHMVMRFDGQAQEMRFFLDRLTMASHGRQSRFLVSGSAGSGKSCLLKHYKGFAQKKGHLTSYFQLPRHIENASQRDAVAGLLQGIIRGFPEVGFNDFRTFVQCIKNMGVGVKAFGIEVSFDWERLNVSPDVLMAQGLENLLRDLAYKTETVVILFDDIQNQLGAPHALDCLFDVLNRESFVKQPLVFGASLGVRDTLPLKDGLELDKQLIRFFSGQMFHLCDFTLDQVRELAFQTLAGTGVDVDGRVVDMVYQYTGGHPYATQIIFNHLYRDQIGGIVGRASFEKSFKSSMIEMYPLFKELYSEQAAEDQSILRIIAERREGLHLKELRNVLLDRRLADLALLADEACRRLLKQNILDEDVQGNLRIKNLMYQEYLLNL